MPSPQSKSPSASPLLVTGASGQLGRRVLEHLLRAQAGPIIALTRSPESLREFAARGVEVRAADFEREADLANAFRGAARALLISTDALDRPGRRLAQHLAALRALAGAGVQHVVYTSLFNPHPRSPITIAADHRETEAALAASRLDFTILRNNCYSELLLMALPPAIASGQLVDARGSGATGFVSREDCARTAAAALLTGSGRRTLDVTGPAALTSDDIAALVSELTGRRVSHISVPADAVKKALLDHGLPGTVADMLVSFDVAIEKGDLSAVAGTVRELTGTPPQSVRDFLAEHRAQLAA
jgi:NAD(P)H dehydrogenase (quinone)